VKNRRILSLIILLAFLAKMTASFGYFKNAPTTGSIDLESILSQEKNVVSIVAKDIVHSQESDNFNLEELRFENEEEDNNDSFHKHFVCLYSINFEIPKSTGSSIIFSNNPLSKSLSEPIFIRLKQLII
jgi:hypothetical protein